MQINWENTSFSRLLKNLGFFLLFCMSSSIKFVYSVNDINLHVIYFLKAVQCIDVFMYISKMYLHNGVTEIIVLHVWHLYSND